MSRSGGPACFPFGATGMLALSRALVLTLCLGGCSFLRRPDEPVDRSRDSWILTSVRDRLDAEPVLAPRDIRVEVDGAIVRLYGNVSGMGEWQCAIRNAQRVPGVLIVVDYLMIERGPRDVRCIAAPVALPEPDFAAPFPSRP